MKNTNKGLICYKPNVEGVYYLIKSKVLEPN